MLAGALTHVTWVFNGVGCCHIDDALVWLSLHEQELLVVPVAQVEIMQVRPAGSGFHDTPGLPGGRDLDDLNEVLDLRPGTRPELHLQGPTGIGPRLVFGLAVARRLVVLLAIVDDGREVVLCDEITPLLLLLLLPLSFFSQRELTVRAS